MVDVVLTHRVIPSNAPSRLDAKWLALMSSETP